jgi:GNAT superfamily N-acetyltransferase
MDKSIIESLIAKTDLSPCLSAKVNTHSYTTGQEDIDIDLSGPEGDTHIYFTIDTRTRAIENIDVEVAPSLRRRKIGRSLVYLMEDIGKIAGCIRSIVQINLRPGFWEYQGYVPTSMGKYEKQLVAA